MNISTKINGEKQSILVEMTVEEATQVISHVVCSEKGAPDIVLSLLDSLAGLPIDVMNATVAACEKMASPQHSAKVLVLKLMQARLLLKHQEKGN